MSRRPPASLAIASAVACVTVALGSTLAGCGGGLDQDRDDNGFGADWQLGSDWSSGTRTCPQGFVASQGACVFSEEAVLELMTSFDDQGLVLVNEEPFMQHHGTQIMRNVWVSPILLERPSGELRDAAELYALVDPDDHELVLDQEFPVGTLIVHEAVDREEGHGIQVKTGLPEDENGRDWWFGKVFDDGTHDETECTPCFACHAADARPGTEGLWGVPQHAM